MRAIVPVATFAALSGERLSGALDARRAGELALGEYDAVHLDCALALDAEDAVLATWDAALGDAAHQTGRLLVNQR